MSSFVYGARSIAKLDTCHPKLRKIAYLGLERSPYDISIIHGWRDEELQNTLVESGVSRTPWPYSAHNQVNGKGKPRSLAFDCAPWVEGTIPWGETHIFAVVAGVLMAAAAELDTPVQWGGDWDGDGMTNDQTLMDWGHLQLESIAI